MDQHATVEIPADVARRLLAGAERAGVSLAEYLRMLDARYGPKR